MFWKVGDTWKLKQLHILLWHAATSSAFLAFKMSFQKQKQKKKSKKKRKETEITGRDLFDQLCLSHRTHTKQHYRPHYHQQQSLKTANPEKYHKYEGTCSETERQTISSPRLPEEEIKAAPAAVVAQVRQAVNVKCWLESSLSRLGENTALRALRLWMGTQRRANTVS